MAQPATKARDLLERHLDWFADVSRSVDELAARRVISAAEDLLPDALPDERAAVYTLIGLGQYRAGRLDRALDAFRNALRVDRSQPCHHHNVAAVLIELGRSQEALRHLDDAQRLPTRSKHDELIGAVNAAEASHRLGDRAAVVAAWRRAQTIATDGKPYDQFLLAHAAAQVGFDDAAWERFVGLADDPPPPTEALRRLMGERGA